MECQAARLLKDVPVSEMLVTLLLLLKMLVPSSGDSLNSGVTLNKKSEKF